MEPRTFSASAFNVAELCLSRYNAEIINRSGNSGNDAASLGTSVHGALENYVQSVILKPSHDPGLEYLIDLYKISYMTTFGRSETSDPLYLEGWEMLCKWFERTDFSTFEVISCELKESFPISTSLGKIPFNYIWDRHDKLGPNEYRIVDYKTNRWGIRPDDLKKKIQARAYGLAAQIKYPYAKRIWVEFDMLRHDGGVGIVFSKEENAATWRFFKELAKRIIDTPAEDAPETLNGECLFCVKKTTCKALSKNILVGGIHSIPNATAAIDTRAELEWQKKAISAAINDLDKMIITEARTSDVIEFESDLNRMSIGVRSTRAIDAEMAEMAIGPEIFNKYGGKSLSLGSVDKLLKGTELTPEQKKNLRSLIYSKKGEPSVKIESKNPIDD